MHLTTILLGIFLNTSPSLSANDTDTLFLECEYAPHTILFQHQGKWGVLDAQHHILIKNEYDFIGDSISWQGMDYYDYFVPASKNGKQGFINEKLHFVPTNGSWSECFVDMGEKGLQPNIQGHFGLRGMSHKNGKKGIIDQQGKWIVRPNYYFLDCPNAEGLSKLYRDMDMQKYDMYDWKHRKMLPSQ